MVDREYVTIVCYFRPTQVDLAGLAHRALKELADLFGDQTASLCAVTESEPPNADAHWTQDPHGGFKWNPHGTTTVDLVSSATLSKLNDVVLICATCNRRGARENLFDFNWSLVVEQGDQGSNRTSDPALILSVGTHMLESTLAERVRFTRFCRNIINHAAASGSMYHGLIDVSANHEQAAGSYFFSGLRGPAANLWRNINHERWERLTDDRPNWIRGVFWATYVNPEMRNRVDPDSSRFLAYEATGLPAQRKPSEALTHTTPDGGLLVQLSPTPVDASRVHAAGEHWLTRNALVVDSIFREAGVLL